MNKIIKTALVIGVLTILLGLGLATTVLSEAEANGGDDMTVILFDGEPTRFDADGSNYPVIVGTVTAKTSEGSATITLTIKDANKDILFGCTPLFIEENQCDPGTFSAEFYSGEHLVSEGTVDFGGGNKLYMDTRIYVSEVSVTKNCGELINNLNRAVIKGGTGRFAGAKDYIEMNIDEFCFDKLPRPVKGSIEGIIVLP